MYIGVCEIQLHIPYSRSLKSKRKIVKSLIERLIRKFKIAVNEVAEQNKWQLATLGIVCTYSDAQFAEKMINQIIGFIEESANDYLVVACERNIISAKLLEDKYTYNNNTGK